MPRANATAPPKLIADWSFTTLPRKPTRTAAAQPQYLLWEMPIDVVRFI